MLYILLNCVLPLSQMFPAMIKPREIHHSGQGTVRFICSWETPHDTSEGGRKLAH